MITSFAMEFRLLLDRSLSSSTIALTLYFFFVQSPFLFRLLGRRRFVPIMMQLTGLFFNVALALNLAVFLLSLSLNGPTLSSSLAFASTVVNAFLIAPRAFKRRRQSGREREATFDASSVRNSTVDGLKTEAKVMHQMVVLFVFINTGALLVHIGTEYFFNEGLLFAATGNSNLS